MRGNRLSEYGNTSVYSIVDTSYTYNVDDKLEMVIKGTNVIKMKYYADRLRAKKESATNSKNYVYNLSRKLVAESKDTSTITANYIWGPDRALVKKEVGGGNYYHPYFVYSIGIKVSAFYNCFVWKS